MTTDGDFSGTSVVRESHRFDVERLTRWLKENVAEFRGPVTVEQFKGGQSNPTYKLVTPVKTYVLRRKPPGTTLKGAHAVDREARVLRALEPTGFCVPHVYGLCTDDQVIGTWFYVMDCVTGRNVWDATFPQVQREDRPRYFDAMNEVIAHLHSIDIREIGLTDFGKAGNYLERQIRRWSKQYLADADAGRDPHLDRLIEWLPAHMPAMLIAGLWGADLRALNIPSESEYVAAYCRRTGRDGIAHLDFFIAFNLFRLAAIFHGIKGRLIRGNASSAHAEKMVTALPVIAQRAWEQALGTRP